MAFREEVDLAKLDRVLSESKARNPELKFSGTREDFKDDTFFVKDDRNDGILGFSLRGNLGDKGTFWEGSFATTEASDGNTRYDEASSLEAITEAFKIAARKWPDVPFSCAYGDSCPWVQELVIGKGLPDRAGNPTDDYRAIDICVKTMESLGVPMVKLDPPERITFESKNGTLDLGLIYCHSVTILFDTRKFDVLDTPIRTRPEPVLGGGSGR